MILQWLKMSDKTDISNHFNNFLANMGPNFPQKYPQRKGKYVDIIYIYIYITAGTFHFDLIE